MPVLAELNHITWTWKSELDPVDQIVRPAIPVTVSPEPLEAGASLSLSLKVAQIDSDVFTDESLIRFGAP